VKRLCNCGILLEKGKVLIEGDISYVTDEYYNLLSHGLTTSQDITDERRRGSGTISFVSMSFSKKKYFSSDDISFSFTVESQVSLHGLYFLLILKRENGVRLTTIFHTLTNGHIAAGEKKSFVLELPKHTLRSGRYPVYLWLGDEQAVKKPRNSDVNYEILDEVLLPLQVEPSSEECDGILSNRLTTDEIRVHTTLRAI
jgi:hypothetical protein